MQERRNKQMAVLFVTLSVITVASYFLLQGKNSANIDRAAFKIEDTKSVDRVDMKSAMGSVKLSFDGTRWKVNDSLDADRQMIQVLFATLEQVEPKRPVTDNIKDSVSRLLRETGVTVSVYEKEKLMKEFLVGGNAQKTSAWFRNLPGEAPYLVGIPGYRVYVSGIFEQNVNEWRDKRAFNFNWRNFKSLTTSFPKEQEQNFSIAKMDSGFGIEGLDVDTAKMNDYLDATSLLRAESFYQKGQNAKFDSLLTVPPSFSIIVKDIANREYALEVYPPLKDNNLVVGKIGREAVLFSKADMVRIAKKRIYFRRSDSEQP